MSSLDSVTGPRPVDPTIQVTGYVQGEERYDPTGLLQPWLRVHTTHSLWPLELDVWSVAAALRAADTDTVITDDTDLDDVVRLVVRGVQRAGWVHVGAVAGLPTNTDVDTEVDTDVDVEDHLMAIEAWGSDQTRRICYGLARVLCESPHTQLLREIPGHRHCPTLRELRQLGESW